MWFATGVSPRPLTFLLYVNYFHKSSKLFEFHLFADDVNIFLSDCNLHTLELKLNEELVNIRTWLFAELPLYLQSLYFLSCFVCLFVCLFVCSVSYVLLYSMCIYVN